MATVEWQTTCTDLKQRGALLRETEEWSDCKLLVGSEKVPFRAHKLMLAMASPVFETMFFVENGDNQDVFIIPDVDPEAFEALTNYIYTENINISSYKKAHMLYLAANKFLILQLARVCAEFMSYNVTLETACSAYDVGYRFQDQQLMFESLQIVKPNIREILRSRNFVDAHIDTVAAIFGIPDIQVDDMELYKALLLYAKANSTRKRSASCEPGETGQEGLTHRTLRRALRHIRFLTFSLEEFAKGPAQSGLFTREESLSILVNLAGGDAPMPAGFTDSRQHRYQRAVTPVPAPSTPRGVLRVLLPSADAFTRSETSPWMLIGGQHWMLTVLPYRETRTGMKPYDDDEQYLAVFLKCRPFPSPADWSSLVRAEFRLLAASELSATTSTTAASGTTNTTASTSHSSSNNKTKTVTIEKTFTSNQNEWGELKFATWLEAKSELYGFVHNKMLTIEAHVTIVKTTAAGGTTITS